MENAEDYIIENMQNVDINDMIICVADYSHLRVINLLERLKTTGIISEEVFSTHFENEIRLTESYKQ